MIKLETKNYNTIFTKKQLKYQPYHQAKYEYEYLIGEEILRSNQQQMIKQAKFTYSHLGNAFEKQIKAIEDQGEKQVEALENLKDHKNQLANDYEDKLLHSKAREIFLKISIRKGLIK